jgi:hypothetical protein
MLFNAMDIIQRDMKDNGGLSVKLGNIGEILSSSGSSEGDDDQIIISLINIEENRLSRDPQPYVRTGINIRKKNPAVHLYLTLLFTSVRAGYTTALLDVQGVIGFFQQKTFFDHANTPLLHAGIEKLTFEMVSLNMEQLQQLWSMLGGKYHPSIVYKVRMVTIDSEPGVDGPLITDIHTTYHLNK